MDLKPTGGLNAIEVAPLVVEANPILPLDDSGKIAKAEAEVADAEARTQRWARERDAVAGRAISIPITSLTGGELTVRASLDDPVQRVKELIKEARGAEGPEPDAQCLVLMLQSGEQRPLEDETVQLGAWGVAEGMTLAQGLLSCHPQCVQTLWAKALGRGGDDVVVRFPATFCGQV